MSRRNSHAKREILPDPIYNSVVVTKFVNVLMERGKKSTAEQILYGALEIVAKKSGEEPLEAFMKALNNIKPTVEVKSRRVGGATYQVPVEVPQNRRQSLAMRWLKTYSSARGERTMRDKLAGEILDAMNFRGAAIKKKDDVHKMAEANKAFAHYRW
ncbi:MAG: 30S ribosomal protein S7 [Acidobacteria bacterium]|nr:30S ribosomal protein S7 [Acidobacteriota bacterium]